MELYTLCQVFIEYALFSEDIYSENDIRQTRKINGSASVFQGSFKQVCTEYRWPL